MEVELTPGAVSSLLTCTKPEFSSELPIVVLQVTNLQPMGTSYGFNGSDGRDKIKGVFNTRLSSEIISGNIQDLGIIRLLDYTVNDLPNKSQKYVLVTKFEVVVPKLENEIKMEKSLDSIDEESTAGVKSNEFVQQSGILLKPKQEKDETKSAAQIVQEHCANMAPAARMAMTRRVHPLVSLNPYQGNWTIKVRVTSKGTMRSYKNIKGEGCVFNVELTDQDGTQIQATMFNEVARKLYDKFELGKVYYISKGSLRVANKQYKTVQNDYEMTLNHNSEVEEAKNEAAFVPETKFNFTPIDQLGPFVNSRELVDVIGVVQSVSPSVSIRRKSDNETIPKRDITIADASKKTVTVSLWNELASNVGQELVDLAETSPIVAIKSLRVGDFQGISLSTVAKSILQINPSMDESNGLRRWYENEGKESSMMSLGSTISPLTKSGGWNMYSDRVALSEITKNKSLGEERAVYFSIRGFVSFVKADQAMWYRACKSCSKKVTDAVGGGYWCEGCQKNEEECSLRYILSVKVSDGSGEGWLSSFNEEAEKIIGCSADELERIKMEDEAMYHHKLKEATWKCHLFRVGVTQREYNNEKRQRITVRALAPLDFAAESHFLLQQISNASKLS